jgi:hypothetical protein
VQKILHALIMLIIWSASSRAEIPNVPLIRRDPKVILKGSLAQLAGPARLDLQLYRLRRTAFSNAGLRVSMVLIRSVAQTALGCPPIWT